MLITRALSYLVREPWPRSLRALNALRLSNIGNLSPTVPYSARASAVTLPFLVLFIVITIGYDYAGRGAGPNSKPSTNKFIRYHPASSRIILFKPLDRAKIK